MALFPGTGKANAPEAKTAAALAPLLGDTYRGQGPDNSVSRGGVVSTRPAVVIAAPASRVSVPMPTAATGVQGELGTWALPGYLSPQEHVAQVPVVGDRPDAKMKSPNISVVTPTSISPINFYAPSGRKVR